MHTIQLSSSELLQLLPADPWTTTLPDLERMAQVLVGPSPDDWVRQRGKRVTIAGLKYGSYAANLVEEMELLTKQANSILTEITNDTVLKAAAFYHLRFTEIHPLRDGNGRIIRTLTAAQCSKAFDIPLLEILAQLDEVGGYKMVFYPPESEQKFELMLDLLSRILAVPLAGEFTGLPFPMEAAYPEVDAPAPMPAPVRSVPIRRAGPKVNAGFWRKFG